MASDNLLMWFGTLFLEWFFMAKKRGDKDEERSVGLENFGWFSIFMTSWIGIALVDNGTNAWAYLLGMTGVIISAIKLFGNWNE